MAVKSIAFIVSLLVVIGSTTTAATKIKAWMKKKSAWMKKKEYVVDIISAHCLVHWNEKIVLQASRTSRKHVKEGTCT